ncbi:class II aldolase/adducin family protein [Planctomycetota bacterium]
MSEEYCGVKFKTVFIQKNILDNPEISELISWCTEFNKMGFTPGHNGSFGNLSFRTETGFIISCSRADFSKIAVEDFTEVTGIDISKKEVYVNGLKKPSSESFMHNEIYDRRDDVNAVFHGHCDDFLQYGDKLGLAITEKEQPAGTIELMTEVIKVLKDNNFILIRNHGFICLGDSMPSAGELAVTRYSQLQKIKKLL